MKFGETLYRRSVPKWAPYNLKYNELKHLIKGRTDGGASIPVLIPGRSINRWQELEDELCNIIQDEYDNIGLFIRSKQGEIERRLSHLEKQVKLVQQGLEHGDQHRPASLARKYQKLVEENESIGDDIEALSRFAAVQKTAFRKILKKYRKWTGSTTLQYRVNNDILSSGFLQVDYPEYLQRLATQTKIIREDLASPMLFRGPYKPATDISQQNQLGHDGERVQQSDMAHRLHLTSGQKDQNASIREITKTLSYGHTLLFDAAISSMPYGQAAGSAYYWIHQDNLDEVQTLLLRHMRVVKPTSVRPRRNSDSSLESDEGQHEDADQDPALSHLLLFDNIQRYLQDVIDIRPSKVALSGRWARQTQAVVTMLDLTPKSPSMQTTGVSKTTFVRALQKLSIEDDVKKSEVKDLRQIQNYVTAHRDLKPMAEVQHNRSRYNGITNSSSVGLWATLDTSIRASCVEISSSGVLESKSETEAIFPHAVLHVRWEFCNVPEVIRALDTSRLVERTERFSLEEVGIFLLHRKVSPPQWSRLLKKDIRKMPIMSRYARARDSARIRASDESSVPTTSDAPLTDEAGDSIFSLPRVQSSATSEEFVNKLPGDNSSSPTDSKPTSPTITMQKAKAKKRARIVVPEPEPTGQRYWNEFDDGDSDTNQQEAYAIYVDPDEPIFPGAETVSKAFGAMYSSLSKGTSKLTSFMHMKKQGKDKGIAHERTPLFSGSNARSQPSSDADMDSTDSESEGQQMPPKPSNTNNRVSWTSQTSKTNNRFSWTSQTSRNVTPASMYRANQQLSPRQKALEKTLMQFYSGLIAVAYVLLIMAGILLGTGRKKAAFEVDAGVVTGVIVAETCIGVSTVLICLRRQQLSVTHWLLFSINVAAVFTIGLVILLALVGRVK